MTKRTRDPLQTLCRECIAAQPSLPRPQRKRIETRLHEIVRRNLERGRFDNLARFRNQSAPLSLSDYVDRVLFFLQQEGERIDCLGCGDPDSWMELEQWLTRRAYGMICRIHRGSDPSEEAANFAQETCLIIFNEPYPFDVSFEAWATTILKNLILARFTRSRDALDRARETVLLDDASGTTLQEQHVRGDWADSRTERELLGAEVRDQILRAIDRLRSPAQQQVIMDSYLAEIEDDEIAKRLGKTRQAVYNLRQRALQRLREILDNERVQESRSGVH